MTDEPINKRDLDFLHEALNRIENSQKITNGRVTNLERNNIYIRGFLAAIGFVFGLPALFGTIIGFVILVRGL